MKYLFFFFFFVFPKGGKYTYLGLEKGIRRSLLNIDKTTYDVIELSFNVDGLPVFKSTKTAVWPVQCSVANIPSVANRPFVAALYSGNNKPQDKDFLIDFVRELQLLCINGIDSKPVKIRNVICDAPARCMVKGIKQFNARHGCDFCDVLGQYKERRMLFLYEGNPRTDLSFRSKQDAEHHKCDSAFLTVSDLDMIKQFPVDPMHCVDLGVTKRLLILWKEGPLPHRLSAGVLGIISSYLECLRPFIPAVFNRKPRRLDDLKFWKATEFRTFLMYTGPVVLKFVLSREQYENFNDLSVAIRILYNETLVNMHHSFANELLQCFVEKAQEMYSEKFVSYNVHCLLHIADHALHFKCLENCSAYKFENNMSTIKQLVRGTGDPLIQISNRLHERERIDGNGKTALVETPAFKRHSCGKLANGKFCRIQEVGKQRHLCEIFTRTEPFYEIPCDSRIVGIHKAKLQHSEMAFVDISDITSTVIGIPLSIFDKDEASSILFISLMHNL